MSGCGEIRQSASVADTLTQAELTLLQSREKHHKTDILIADDVELVTQKQMLKTPSRPLNPASRGMDLLLGQMQLSMRANFGTGLAAVQIGIPVRVVLLQTDAKDKNRIQFIFNPQVVEIDAVKERKREQCLSLPNTSSRLVERASSIKIRYQKAEGTYETATFHGQIARVLQHEIDHLNGMTLLDRPNLTP